MADNKNYVSVINNGTTDYYVKDEEARAAIPTYASSETCAAIVGELR